MGLHVSHKCKLPHSDSNGTIWQCDDADCQRGWQASVPPNAEWSAWRRLGPIGQPDWAFVLPHSPQGGAIMMSDPKQLLDAYASESGAITRDDGIRREQCARKAFAALRAVVELHPPCALGSVMVCGRCRYDTGEPEKWPCPTVTAITTALED